MWPKIWRIIFLQTIHSETCYAVKKNILWALLIMSALYKNNCNFGFQKMNRLSVSKTCISILKRENVGYIKKRYGVKHILVCGDSTRKMGKFYPLPKFSSVIALSPNINICYYILVMTSPRKTISQPHFCNLQHQYPPQLLWQLL